MWDKLRRLLDKFVHLLMAIILVAAMGTYVFINSVLVMNIINELRLDTYVSLETGFGIVMVILLLGWGPVWLARQFE